MRTWIDAILQSETMGNMRKHTIPITQTWNNKRRMLDPRQQYLDSHLEPNTHGLLGQDYQNDIPFTFIGNLYNYNNDYPQILKPFLVDKELIQDRKKLMKYLARMRGRTKDNKFLNLTKFSINRSELSDNDISNLCDVYWMDYLCLPFDIPIECDLEKMYNDHYGIEFTYKDCY